MAVDIMDLKQDTQGLFRALFEQHESVSMLIDPNDNGRIVFANRACAEFYGYTREEMVGMSIRAINVLPADEVKRRMAEAVGRALNRFEFPHRLSDGSVRTVEVHSSPIDIDGRRLLYSIVRDITDHRRVHQRLVENEAKYRGVIERAADGIVLVDEDGFVIEWNAAQERLTGIPMSIAMGRPIWELQVMMMAEEDRTEENLEIHKRLFSTVLAEGIQDQASMRREATIQVDGERRRIEQMAFSIRTQKGYRVCSIARDISRHRTLQEKLERSVREKDDLLKEVNHRVKNNLLMVTSLLRLKQVELGRNVDLSDLEHQIDAIRIVHEKLAHSDSVTHVDLGQYIGDLLSAVFGRMSTRPVRIENTIGVFDVATRTAVPLALIINELALNAIKHGFSNAAEAVFSVGLERHDLGNSVECVLEVANTGNPIDDAIDFENSTTLGFRLIYALTDQIQATLSIVRKPIPVFTIRFPLSSVE